MGRQEQEWRRNSDSGKKANTKAKQRAEDAEASIEGKALRVAVPGLHQHQAGAGSAVGGKRESFAERVEGLLEALSHLGLIFARLPPSPPSDRKRSPSTESGVDAAAPKRKMTATTVRKTMMATTISMILVLNQLSHLNLNNLPNYKVSNRLQCDPCSDESVTNRVREQRTNEARVHDEQHNDNQRRKHHQQQHSQATLSSVNLNLAQYLKALADHVRKVIEDFGKVAARFALEHNCGDEEFHVH